MKFINECNQFKLSGNAIKVEPYGDGHINETYFVLTDSGSKYILQKVNDRLFNVPQLMSNISLVTSHIRKKLISVGRDADRETLTLVPTKSGETFLKNENGYFRVYIFIDNATAYQVVLSPSIFNEGAKAFGDFQNLLADFDAGKLFDVLPNFHNTVIRYQNFINAVRADKMGRAKSVQKEIDFVCEREKYCSIIVDKLEQGLLPLNVTHNDTKFNNVMIDDYTGEAVAVIDLDTIMKGSSLYDFGDSIRFGCNSSTEDNPDLSQVNFRLDLFKAFAKGYLSQLKSVITPQEKDTLAVSAIIMTLECGMRFLTDHLEGDTYFKIHRQNHNIDRCRTQFKLIQDMEANLEKMQQIIKEL